MYDSSDNIGDDVSLYPRHIQTHFFFPLSFFRGIACGIALSRCYSIRSEVLCDNRDISRSASAKREGLPERTVQSSFCRIFLSNGADERLLRNDFVIVRCCAMRSTRFRLACARTENRIIHRSRT